MDRYPQTFLAEIKKLEQAEFFSNIDLSLYSTMRLKAQGDLFVLKSIKDSILFLQLMSSYKIDYNILGLGANMVLPEYGAMPYVQIKLPFNKKYLDKVRDVYDLPSSISLSILSLHAVKNNLKGWECFTGIPATLGGAIAMNAGTGLGEIGKLIKSVNIIKREGVLKSVMIDEMSFSYRKNHFLEKGDLIVGAQLIHEGVNSETSEIIKSYLKQRTSSQPLKAFTCGCIFKNHEKFRAGQLIDRLGLKGLQVGKVRISLIHANFMENLGGGTKSDVLKLITILNEEIYLNFGIFLETEAITLD